MYEPSGDTISYYVKRLLYATVCTQSEIQVFEDRPEFYLCPVVEKDKRHNRQKMMQTHTETREIIISRFNVTNIRQMQGKIEQKPENKYHLV